jgi:glycopeptide antibiotics resistance protein
MKQLHKTALAVYIVFLLWLVLFKTSTDFISVLTGYQSRSLNLTPFAGYSPGNVREMIDNFIVFVPLGLLLGIVFNHVSFWRKLAWIFTFSFVAEVAQYVFAIGTTDITDLITNTFGGLFGLAAYSLASKHINSKWLDQAIVIIIGFLLIAFLILRFMVFKVRY